MAPRFSSSNGQLLEKASNPRSELQFVPINFFKEWSWSSCVNITDEGAKALGRGICKNFHYLNKLTLELSKYILGCVLLT